MMDLNKQKLISNDGKIWLADKSIDIVEMEEKLNKKLEASNVYWVAGFILSIFGLLINWFVITPIQEFKSEFQEFKSEIKIELKNIEHKLEVQSERTDYLFEQNNKLFQEFLILSSELKK